MYSQGLSPQAQAVLNRLPPEQRAMALQEANRLRGSAGTVQSNNAVPIADAGASVEQVDSSDIEESSEIKLRIKSLFFQNSNFQLVKI